MSANKNSTIEFKSNLFPVVADEILHDERFLHSLRDPLALQEFKKRAYRHHPTALQREIIDKGVGVECMYADPGDLAWGTVRENGIEKIVCLCEKYSCELFPECRPGVAIPADEPSPVVEESVELAEGFEASFGDTAEPNVDDGLLSTSAEAAKDEHRALEIAEDDLSVYTQTGEETSEDVLGQSEIQLLDEAADGNAAFSDSPAISVKSQDGTDDRTDEVEGAIGRYDEHQAAIVCAEPFRRMYVNAGPGAGKTHTLIEKIKYLMEEREVEPDRITVLSFTRAAVSVIQNRLKAAAEQGEIHALWQDVDVTTFDKLCTRLLYYVAGERSDEAEKKRISKLDYDQRIVRAKNLIASNPELLSGCDHLIVDETQDLVGPRADLVLTMIGALPQECGFTLFGDRCQSIYEYQVKDGGTSSGEFFEQVSLQFAPDQVYLEKNYRQKPSYPLDLSDLRAALLDDDAERASELIKKVAERLGAPSESMRSLEPEFIQGELAQGKMGVLTRNNDAALEIEALLWKLGVPAVQVRSDARKMLSRCVADAFVKCKGETITQCEFEELIAPSDPYGDGRVWRALLSVEGVRLEGDRLRISDALAALNGAILPAALLAERNSLQCITVSTVHASKGREFDSVWMLAENIADFQETSSMEEKRVAYVGLTRGSGNLALQCLDEHFIVGGKNSFRTKKMRYRDRYYRKRSSGRGRTGKSRVVNIEVRNEIDVDVTSIGSSGKAQEALASGSLEGEQVRFVLRGTGDNVRYDIVLQDDEGFVLGRLTRTFIDDYRRCSGDLEAPLPDAFDQVYIDRITTCIGRANAGTAHGRSFGDMAVWYGFAIGGYAHRDDSQGY